MNLHCYFAKIVVQMDKNGAKLTHPSTNIRLPNNVSKNWLHETAIKLTVYIAPQNTETSPVFKGKPAERLIQIAREATACISVRTGTASLDSEAKPAPNDTTRALNLLSPEDTAHSLNQIDRSQPVGFCCKCRQKWVMDYKKFGKNCGKRR